MRPAYVFVVYLFATICSAQDFTTIHKFSFGEAYDPMAAVSFDRDGTLYGTTAGDFDGGSALYSIDSSGTERVLRFFGSQYGSFGYPQSRPLIDAQRNIYGTTAAGGLNDLGTVWRRNPSGKLGLLWQWGKAGDSSLGETPVAGVIRDPAGNLYGTTRFGGAYALGTAYKIEHATRTFTLLHSFGASLDGCRPNGEPLLGQDGYLYGILPGCGALGYGSLFKLDPTTGAETVLYNFTNGTDGGVPSGNLIQDPDGNLYGTAWQGGDHGNGVIYKFDLTTNTLTTLYAFGTVPDDGEFAYAGLARDPAGNLYGTTFGGGGNERVGTVFELRASGDYRVLHRFTGGADGLEPYAGVTLHQGSVYGVTTAGGDPYCYCGVVFSINP